MFRAKGERNAILFWNNLQRIKKDNKIHNLSKNKKKFFQYLKLIILSISRNRNVNLGIYSLASFTCIRVFRS